MLRPEQFHALADLNARPAVSIYAPTYDSGTGAIGSPTHFKNGMQRAERMLEEFGAEKSVINDVLAPGRDFLADLKPNDYGAGTLVALLAPGVVEILHSPLIVEEQVFVSDRLHLKPLLPVLTENSRFYVLAASRDEVRLFDCTRYSQTQRPLAHTEVPRSLEDATPESEPAEGPQDRLGRPRMTQHRGSSSVYYGWGHENSTIHHRLFHFMREVNDGLVELLDRRSPLVFAGVDELFAIYREANTYDHLADAHVSGNPTRVRPEELREAAWGIVAAQMEGRVAQAHDDYGTLAARGRATDDIKAVVLAARDGLAGTVIGATDRIVWGRVPETGEDVEYRVEPEPWDYDLIDYAAIQVMDHNGTALMVPGPRVPGEGRGAAALLRY